MVLLIFYDETESATLKDVFTLSTQPISRIPRDNKYSANRYATNRDDTIKPEESPEARDDQDTRTNVEKRCSRCDSQYSDYNRYPSSYDTRTRYDGNRYDNNRYDDRYYESKRNRDRYDYDDRDRYYDRYDRDRGYDRRVDYDRYDRGYDRGSYDRGGYDRGGYDKGGYDKGGYDRVGYDRGYDRGYDKHDNRDRYYDRGSGYDNRGYDYRGGYRPWDETYRGTSGWDSSGRGFYFATGRPESSSSYGSGYASSWNYGGGRDNYNRDRGFVHLHKLS